MNTLAHIRALERLPSEHEKTKYLMKLAKSSPGMVDPVIKYMECAGKKEIINIIFMHFLQKQIFKTVCLDVAKKEGWSDSVDLIERIYFKNLEQNISTYSSTFFSKTYTKIRSIFPSIPVFIVKYFRLVCEGNRYDLADIILSNTNWAVIDSLVTYEFSFITKITSVQSYFITKHSSRYTFKVHPTLKKIVAVKNC
jgi:hypothetical protein